MCPSIVWGTAMCSLTIRLQVQDEESIQPCEKVKHPLASERRAISARGADDVVERDLPIGVVSALGAKGSIGGLERCRVT